MPQRRVIYFLGPYPAPSGGRANIYRHVEILSKYGIEAYAALPEKPEVDFYGTTAPLLIGDVNPQGNDICVIPETRPSVGISEFGVHGVFVSSFAIQRFFRDVYKIPDLPLIPYAIDTKRFSTGKEKRREIAFMPRKLEQDALFITNTFKRRHKRYADVPWGSDQ